VLPAPRVPDGLTITLFPKEVANTKGANIPDNGICERFHKTVLQEFYQVAFRKRIYTGIEQLQTDLDAWITGYNRASEHPSVYVIEEKRLC
jgi:Integrase core domain